MAPMVMDHTTTTTTTTTTRFQKVWASERTQLLSTRNNQKRSKINRSYTTPYQAPRHRIVNTEPPHNNIMFRRPQGHSLLVALRGAPKCSKVLASERTQFQVRETIKTIKNQSLLHRPLPGPQTQNTLALLKTSRSPPSATNIH